MWRATVRWLNFHRKGGFAFPFVRDGRAPVLSDPDANLAVRRVEMVLSERGAEQRNDFGIRTGGGQIDMRSLRAAEAF